MLLAEGLQMAGALVRFRVLSRMRVSARGLGRKMLHWYAACMGHSVRLRPGSLQSGSTCVGGPSVPQHVRTFVQGVSGNGKYFKYLTPIGALWRFATAWGRKGRFYAPDGKAVLKKGGVSPGKLKEPLL